MRNPTLFKLLLLSAGILTLGCGSSSEIQPVTGKVLLSDGSPADTGVIKFRTVSDKGEEVKAFGQIQSDGSFQLTTFEEGDGAILGEHEALLFLPAIGDGQRPMKTKSFPTKYRNYETSGLKFNVGPGENDFVIRLEAR
ncbi:hypothetical protein AB1L30_06955 [Bremerella sp. JC817]|uniref:hypothetical protein n=1 Tax=Bremerella sp. JC817 TaxID=3231756 RepID=UPI003457B5A0